MTSGPYCTLFVLPGGLGVGEKILLSWPMPTSGAGQEEEEEEEDPRMHASVGKT